MNFYFFTIRIKVVVKNWASVKYVLSNVVIFCSTYFLLANGCKYMRKKKNLWLSISYIFDKWKIWYLIDKTQKQKGYSREGLLAVGLILNWMYFS